MSNRKSGALLTKTRLSKESGKSSISRQVTFRLLLVWLVLLLGSVGLASRLYYLQVIDPVIYYEQAPKGRSLKEIARSQQTTSLKLYTPRRQIVDRNQNVLATDRITYKLYVHPSLFIRNSVKVPAAEVAQKLADILKTQTAEELLTLFNQHKWGIPLADNLSESVPDKIRALRIDGLDLRKQYSRFYPHQEMVAEVVGYINQDLDRKPQAGLEYTQNNLLERPPVSFKLKRSFFQDQSIFYPGDLKRSQKIFQFDDLRLQTTIDLRLQQSARQALKRVMEQYKAKRGAVIVIDVRDGSIPVLVCEPTYDPNRYNQYSDYSLFKNWAITDLYEPGSTFKPINIAIALEAGVISPQDKFEDTGEIKIDTHIIRNHDYEQEGARGELSIPEILQHSSNIGMIKIMSRMSRTDFYEKLQQLGIEDKLELEIPGYTPGQLRDEAEFSVREIDSATAAFGQGFSLTPLKLLQLHAAIANGGNLVTPHLVKGLADFDGYLHYQIPSHSQKIWNPQTTRTVLEMMETVVENGSGINAQVPGYRIAGKTGTAQKINQTGEYDAKAKITSFVGIFPVEKPRYAILAVVDEPDGQWTFGSTVAAPIVKEVIEAIIADEGIPPFNFETITPN